MAASKIKKIIKHLSRCQPGAVAFSGGVDSTLLLYLAREAWVDPPLAVTFLSPLLTAREKKRIEELADFLKIRHHFLKTREYQDPRFKKNTPIRCYFCKKSRFDRTRPFLNQKGISFFLDGTNADDLRAYRPGIRASQEAGVISPLALYGLTKKEIRQFSRDFGLPTWDLPSSPCLATRIVYGQPITLPLLKRLAEGEELLGQMGFSEFRLRVHNSLARVEVPEKEFALILNAHIKQNLLKRLSDLGFTHITLDLKGFRSGSMDEHIRKRKRSCSDTRQRST
jgi:pyridinium-3,5-biscarboxylic acid mononucleotide sulfurtransferase